MTANIPGLEPVVQDVVLPEGEPAARRGRRLSRRRLYLRRFLRNKGAVAGLVILALLVLFALAGGLLTTYTYSDVDFTSLG